MSKIGYGYGSECHLLRWMGRHRNAFDRAVVDTVGSGSRIEWLDFNFKSENTWPDAELKGLEFLCDAALQSSWREFWPVGSGIHNWDTVGWLIDGDGRELLLVEAKAHVGELRSDCKAESPDSIDKIRRAFAEVKRALGVPEERDWIKGYYQVTNRIATLYFLERQGVRSRLLFLYFVGDRRNNGCKCPKNVAEWEAALRDQERWVGLPSGHGLAGQIHKMFLPVHSPEL